MTNERTLSCVQPTAGMLHLGNLFGAIVNWLKDQAAYPGACYFGIVPYHALTTLSDGTSLRANTVEVARSLLACGLDAKQAVFFCQSLVPEHTELAWVFSCSTAFGELSRMTQFKEKAVKGSFVNAGLLTYPILMAADIALYRAVRVPVGEDQLQHLELARAIIRRFNQEYGEFFPAPRGELTEAPRVMSLADPTKKMSKSLGRAHYIEITEPPESIRKKVMSAVTDFGAGSGAISPGVANLLTLLQSTGSSAVYSSMVERYEQGTLQYREFKEAVADALIAYLAPIRERYESISPDEALVTLKRGSEQARAVAVETMREVRAAVGIAF